MQFAAQSPYYREHYPDTASTSSSSMASRSDGSMSPAWSDEIRIVDIALLPACCNRGMGTTLVRGLQAEAAAAGKPLRIHVERFNPALRLYERLGFRQIDDRGVYLFMEWRGVKTTPNFSASARRRLGATTVKMCQSFSRRCQARSGRRGFNSQGEPFEPSGRRRKNKLFSRTFTPSFGGLLLGVGNSG